EDLDHVNDLEPGCDQQPYEIAMSQLELGLFCVGPIHAVHAELRPLQFLLDLPRVGRAQDRERRVAKEDELAVWSKKPRGFGDPLVWIAPDRGAVFRDREIEGGPRKTGGFGVRLEELQAEPILRVHPPGGIALR